MGPPTRIEAFSFILLAGWTIELHLVALVVTRTVGQTVVPNSHPVIGQLQVLAGIIVDVV
jgi:hypothetical protein